MGRPALTIQDYQVIAGANDLQCNVFTPPSTIYTPVEWECLVCGRKMRKSYHDVKYGANACMCRNSLTLKAADYHKLAHQLNIQWIGSHLPQNNKDETLWRSVDGRLFNATYHELAYAVPKRLRKYLDVPEVS